MICLTFFSLSFFFLYLLSIFMAKKASYFKKYQRIIFTYFNILFMQCGDTR